MAARDEPLVRMNDALVPIVHASLRAAGPRSAACRRLDASVRAVRGVGRGPDARVRQLADAGLDEIEHAAQACLDGDVVRTRQLAGMGLEQRAAASLELDEALEGE